jgi:ethanolamine utilization cobalamin adenosyltransferase
MTLSYHLGLYSTNKKNRLRQTIKIGTIIATAALLFLIGRQILLKINNRQGQIITPESENILDAINKLAPKESLVIESIKEEPDMIILLLEGEIEVFLDKKKSTEPQLKALQLIINQDKINGRKAKKIDLRFNNPIVTY